MSPPIPFTLTGAHTCNFTMLPQLVSWFSWHLTLLIHQARPPANDKRSLHLSKPPHFFFLIYHDNGASSELWHAEVDYLNVHFAGESEKWERMEHYDESLAFQLHFWSLPSLWLGTPHQVFLGRLREWDSLLLGRTVWQLSDLCPTIHSCVTPENLELFHFRKR